LSHDEFFKIFKEYQLQIIHGVTNLIAGAERLLLLNSLLRKNSSSFRNWNLKGKHEKRKRETGSSEVHDRLYAKK